MIEASFAPSAVRRASARARLEHLEQKDKAERLSALIGESRGITLGANAERQPLTDNVIRPLVYGIQLAVSRAPERRGLGGQAGSACQCGGEPRTAEA